MDERIGNVQAGDLWLQARVTELDFEVHEGEFGDWQEHERGARRR